MEQTITKLISLVGEAKSNFIEAISEARNYNFVEAKHLVEAAEKLLVEGHTIHFEIISKEANGEAVEFSLLLVHAEDQLMSAEVFGVSALEMIYLHEKVNKLEAIIKEIRKND